MTDQAIVTLILGGTGALSQIALLLLCLKIRISQLESEKAINARSDCRYPSREVCDERMDDHERRIAVLEGRV